MSAPVSDTQGPYREGEQVRLKLANGQTISQWGSGKAHEWELLVANAAYAAGKAEGVAEGKAEMELAAAQHYGDQVNELRSALLASEARGRELEVERDALVNVICSYECIECGHESCGLLIRDAEKSMPLIREASARHDAALRVATLRQAASKWENATLDFTGFQVKNWLEEQAESAAPSSAAEGVA